MPNTLRILAYSLFGVGVTVAITCGAKQPASIAMDAPLADKFPDTLPGFLAGVLLAVIGIVLWRADLKREQREADAGDLTDDRNPVALLQGVVAPARALLQDIGQLNGKAITVRVDELLDNFILPFAEVRQGIVRRFGMREGAELLVTVAYGERMLNRTWSAAADGHLPEANASFPEAVQAFELAEQQLQQALAARATDETKP